MRFSRTIAFLLIACALTTSIIVFYYAQRYQNIKQNHINHAAQQALHQLSYGVREYANIQDQLFSIIHLLSHSQTTCDYAFSPEPNNQRLLEEAFASVAHYQKWYNSIVFFDNEGQANVGVMYSATESSKVISHALDNQLSSERLALAELLSDEQVGIWGWNTPDPIPSMQLITPVKVFGLRYGYIMMDINLWRLAERVSYSLQRDLQPEIVTDQGVVLSHKLSQHALMKPFILDDNLAQRFPLTWQRMQTANTGYQLEQGHLIAFASISLTDDQAMYLIVHLTPEELAQRAERDLNDLIKEGLFVLLMVMLFTLPTLSMVLHYHRRDIESKLARAALNGMTAVMIADKHHQIMMVNNEFERMTGLPKAWAIGRNGLKTLLYHNGMPFILSVLERITSEHYWQGEVEFATAQGDMLTTLIRIQGIIEAGRVSYYITSIVDITERKLLENKLRELSEKDSLTQLWNRRKFELELTHQVERIQAEGNAYPVCLVLLDIDFFKRVNDEQGHDQGDRVIIDVARLLTQHLRSYDFIARIGGEEFAVIMPSTRIEQAQQIIERLRGAVEAEPHLSVTVSAGITDLTLDATRSYKCADIALYESKKSGRNQVSTFLSQES